MITVTAQKQDKVPTTSLNIKTSIPIDESVELNIGQFYKGLPPFMGGGEPEPAGLYIEANSTGLDGNPTLGTVHMTREDVKGLHAELGAWLEGKWGVDRPEAPDLNDLAKSLLGGVK
jgi:hypothetical protein